MSTVTLTGTGYWINPKNFKEWPRSDGKVDRVWSMVLAPDDRSRETILDLQMKGLKNRLKRNDAGEIVVSFSRKKEKEIKGRIVSFEPPFVKDENDVVNPDLNIGNGSTVEVYLDVYEHNVPGQKNKSIAARWDGVKVTKLVPYQTTKKEEDTTEKLW